MLPPSPLLGPFPEFAPATRAAAIKDVVGRARPGPRGFGWPGQARPMGFGWPGQARPMGFGWPGQTRPMGFGSPGQARPGEAVVAPSGAGHQTGGNKQAEGTGRTQPMGGIGANRWWVVAATVLGLIVGAGPINVFTFGV